MFLSGGIENYFKTLFTLILIILVMLLFSKDLRKEFKDRFKNLLK